MSDLLTTEEGRSAVIQAQRFLLQRRLSRFFKRNLVISYNEWLSGNGFNLAAILGELNEHHDEEILNLYRLLSLVGGLEESIADMRIYVDAVDGDDDEGDGSEENPFASLWFIGNLPKTINHKITIFFVNDYSGDGLTLDYSFGDGGQIDFVGVGAPTVIESHVVAVGGVSAVLFDSSKYITVVDAPTIPCNGDFLVPTEGADIGKAQVIQRMDGSVFVTLADSTPGLLDGEGLDTVRPSRTVSFDYVSISGFGCMHNTALAKYSSAVNFINMRLDLSSASAFDERAVFEHHGQLCVSMQFVQVLTPAAGTVSINGQINTASAENYGQLTLLSESGITNLGYAGPEANEEMCGASFLNYGDSCPVTVGSGGVAHWISPTDALYTDGDCRVKKCGAAYFSCSNSFGAIEYVCQANNAAGPAIELANCRISLTGLCCFDAVQIIEFNSNSHVVLDNSGADYIIGFPEYGIFFNSTGLIEFHYNPGVKMDGNTADIRFTHVSPAANSSIPAPFGWVQNQGAVVSRLSL